jgi:hypothetical protein
MLEQRLPDALRDAAVGLAVDESGSRRARVVDRGVAHDLDLARLRAISTSHTCRAIAVAGDIHGPVRRSYRERRAAHRADRLPVARRRGYLEQNRASGLVPFRRSRPSSNSISAAGASCTWGVDAGALGR